MDWTTNFGPTSSTGTGPDVDHTLGTASGKYVYLESSCTAVREGDLVSPYLDLRTVSGLVIDFWYHMHGAGGGFMHLDVDTTQGTGAWVNDVTPAWTADLNAWQNKQAPLSQFTGKDSVRIRIRGNIAAQFTQDFGLDDILLYIPSPYDLVASSITGLSSGCNIGNQNPTFNGIQNGFDTLFPGDTIPMNYSVNGGTPHTENYILTSTILPGASFSYTFTTPINFSATGTYTIDVWSSLPVDPFSSNDTLSTQVTSIPVLSGHPVIKEDFESGTNGWMAGGNTTFAFGTPAKTTIIGASSGVNAWVTGGLGTGFYNDGENGWVQSPCYDLSQFCNPYLRLRHWYNAEFSWDGANVQYSTDGGTTWVLIGNVGDPHAWYTDNSIDGMPGGVTEGWSGRASTSNGSGGWVTGNHHLTALANSPGAIFRVNFATDGSVTDDGFAFDDFIIYDNVYLGDDITACSSPVNLTTYSTQSETVLWSNGSTLPTSTITTTGWYSAQVTLNGNCSRTDSIYVYFNDPNAVALGADSTVCSNAYQLEAIYVPQATYFWSNGDTTSTMGSSMDNWTTVTTAGTYSVAITSACGTIMDTIVLGLNPLPAISLSPTTTGCGSALLIAGNQGVGYVWSTGDTTQMITATTPGTYSVTVTDAAGCTNQGSTVLSIFSNPIVIASADTSICANGTTALMVLNVDPNCSYSWTNGDTGSTGLATAAGLYAVLCTDSNGCVAADSVNVTLLPNPVANFTFSQTANQTLTFVDGSSNGTAWAWDFGDGNTSALQSPTHFYANSGPYIVTQIVTNACGADTSTQSVFALGVEDGFGNDISVFPNPNRGDFNVLFKGIEAYNVRLDIVNLVGQTIHTEMLDHVGEGYSHALKLGALPQGYYFVRMDIEGKAVVRKMMVE